MIDNFNSLCIGKYLEIQKIAKDEELAEIDKQVAIIAILADMSEDEVLDLPILEYRALAEKSKFLEYPMDVPKHTVSTIEIAGWTLIPTTDIRKMTTAQYIDFQTFSKEGEEKVVETLSCFLVPKGKKYNEDYDIVELQQAIRDNLSIPLCFGLIGFFLAKFKQLMLGTLIYCKWMTKLTMKKGKEKKEMLMKIENLMKELPNGDGLVALMQ